MKRSRLFATILLGLGLTLVLFGTLRGLSGSVLAREVLAPIPPSLARQHAPVVIAGSLLPDLTCSSLEEIFVYAYEGTNPTQIPFQIDERDAGGMYVAVEDGQLDGNDELVFMAMDGGSWVDHPSLDAGGTSISPAYVITITDPISGTHAWAYVFCSDALSRIFTADYVSYDGSSDRITSPGWYTLGFSATRGFLNYLALGDSSSNLFDRSKLRITGTLDTPYGTFPLYADEDAVTLNAVRAIDGPVRITRVSTSTQPGIGTPTERIATIFAYRSLVVQPKTIAVPEPPVQIDYVRTSLDWNENAAGMTYYDANNPTGVTIDGISDIVTVTPPTRWMQVTGLTGTVVNVSSFPSGLGGAQSTYYKDDSAVDSDDTGDQRAFGDAGFQVKDPTPGTYIIFGHTYFLTGTTTNVGAACVDYYDNPIRVSVAAVTPMWYIYLPAVMRE